jgi:hypothetical protein
LLKSSVKPSKLSFLLSFLSLVPYEMQPAASLLPAGTIPAPPRVCIIRVTTHTYRGEKYDTPLWHVHGDLRHYEVTHRWRHLFSAPLVLGKQDDGDYILDVTDLGLDADECLAYADAKERCVELQDEEYRYNLHSDSSSQCLCGEIAEQQAIMDKYESKITDAVNERFDAWTRRRHLVALGVALGFPDFDRPAWLERLGLVPEPEVEAPAAAGAAAVDPAPYPVAADWTI